MKFNKKILFISTACIITVSLIFTIFYFINKKDELEIKNYSQIVKNLPEQKKHLIFRALFDIVKQNGVNPYSAGDAIIRQNTHNQSYSDKDELYSGSFIVDLSSIKQSYKINYNHANNIKESLYSYAVKILCLDPLDVIYNDFKCIDEETSTNTDPYSTVSKLSVEYIEPLLTILSIYNQNQINVDLDKFIKTNIKTDIGGAIVKNCIPPNLENSFYQCDIDINPEIIKLVLFIGERNNAIKYSLSYGSLSEEYTIKIQ